MKRHILPLLLLVVSGVASAVQPLWMRDMRLSPDGSQVAFTYKGAIYKVPSAGGQAVRLTSGDNYNSSPVWSPDGSKIAFASDRNGGTDVYVMGSDGSNPTRLTWNSAAELPQSFTPDGKSIYFTALIEDPSTSVLAPVATNKELYTVPVSGGRIEQVLAVPVNNVRTVPGTGLMVYEDIKGGENQWRKHHTSSVTRDIWSWDSKKGKFTNLTSLAGEDREPAPAADGKTLYFLSERDGSFNVYEMPVTGGAPKKVTDYTTHPVRFLSTGSNGLVAFTWNGRAYTMKPGEKPREIKIEVTDPGEDPVSTLRYSTASGAKVSPDGSQIAFLNRGEVFVTSTKYGSTKQITHTAAGESDLSWGKDGRTLYYTSYRTGRPNIYKASIARSEDPNFSNATLINEEAVFPEDGVERADAHISPDGKKMAYYEGRTTLKVRDLATGKSVVLNKKPINNYRSLTLGPVWSPDSRWLAVEYQNPLHEPYTDIAIINAEDGEFIPVTRTAYFDGSPRWSADGQKLLFESDRFGMRSHASWGSENDVMMVFLTQDAYDRYRLSEEDFALLKEVEKEQKKAAKSEGDTKDGKGKKDGSNAKDENLVKIDRKGLEDRVVRLTPNSSALGDFALSKDGETLYYLASFEKGQDLWKKDLRKGDVSMVKKLGTRAGIQTDNDGNFYLTGMRINKFDPKTKELKPVSIGGSMKMDRAAEREAMLNFVKNEARERFYLPEMPVDWDMYVENYRQFLPHISKNQDFADLLSELLGELNVSHSGGRYRAGSAQDPTGSLGLMFDVNYKGDGRRVTEIVEGGPFDRATAIIKPGDIITSVNGIKLDAGHDWAEALNNTIGKKTLVTFRTPSGAEKEEVVLPISAGMMNELLYNRWVKGRAAAVDSLSKGRLGYVHLRGMNDASFRQAYAKLLGEYVGKDGIVVDTRWNGGGRLHEDIEVLLSGEKYLTQEIHGRKSSEFPSRRWNRPSVMVTGEANYSNAHGTPWVYSHKKLGKIVGMPVPGTMSSVNWIDLQDPEVYFGVPVVAFRTNDGVVLENTQLEPDVKVANTPDGVVAGKDAQIEAAVKVLLEEIDKKK